MQEFMQFFGNHTILVLLWLGLLIAVIVTTLQMMFSKVKEINRTLATQYINKEDAVIVDIRAKEEFRKGHIVHAINLLPSEIKQSNLGELQKKAKTAPIIVVCAQGISARQSAQNLLQQGFSRVYVLKEGIAGWQADKLPLVRS